MKIRIEVDSPGPTLRILPELPDARLAILEGLNGIGKTLAVRLLQICTGESPYREDSPAWTSLRSNLGEFQVTVTGLAGASEIKWVADSREWHRASTDRALAVKFETLSIDGRIGTIDEVRRLLSVSRLGGEDGIVETLAQQADAYADVVRRWRRRYTEVEKGPLAALEARVSVGLRLLNVATPDEFTTWTRTAEEAEQSTKDAEKAIADYRKRHQEATEAVELRHRLRKLRERAPDLIIRLERVNKEIAKAETAREGLLKQVNALAQQVAASRPVVKELQNAQRTLDLRRRELSANLGRAAVMAAELDILAELAAVEAFVRASDGEILALEKDRTELDAAPSIRGLIERIEPSLAEAESRGLGDQIAVEDVDLQVELTVSQTRAGLLTRHQFLEGKPPPPQAQELEDKIEAAKSVRKRAQSLRSVLLEVTRLKRLVGENEERARRALIAINPQAVDQMNDLDQKRREHDDQLLSLATTRAALAEQLGAIGDETTEGFLSSQLDGVLTRLGIGVEELDGARQVSEVGLRNAENAAAQAGERQTEARRELMRIAAEARRSIANLTSNEEIAWLHVQVPNDVLNESASTIDQLGTVDTLRKRAQALNNRLGALREQLGAVELALTAVGHKLRGNPPRANEYLPEMEAWLSHHFSSWFNGPGVKQLLLPDAEGDVLVDVAARDVVWQKAGTTVSRPLEAFSSGEQAFVYTRARLARLDEEETRAANRLIVLDEFGAFIAHDRLAELLSYLQKRADDHPLDQVVVMLPLIRDYAELARNAIGDEAERLEGLAKQIEERQYAVQVLVQ